MLTVAREMDCERGHTITYSKVKVKLPDNCKAVNHLTCLMLASSLAALLSDLPSNHFKSLNLSANASKST